MSGRLRLAVALARADRRRHLGTLVAVVLGVSFLSGTLVMGDTLRGAFDTMFGEASGGTDAVVRGADAITVGTGDPQRAPVDTALLDRLRGVDEVAAAEAAIEGTARLMGADGRQVGGEGPATLAGNWLADPELNPYQLAEGRAPERSGEVVVNRGAAGSGGLAVGDTTTLLTPEPVSVTVVGVATFGAADGMGEVSYAGLTTADAERLLAGGPGRADSLRLRAAPGVGQDALVAAVTPLLPAGVEAVTGEEFGAESVDAVSGRFLDGFTTGLTAFAGVALLVATFGIHNTFAVVVARRTRRNGLLRALGAGRRQLLGQTVAEAAAVGAAGGLLGVVGGIGVAAGLSALFSAFGFPFPEGALVVDPAALLAAFAVGPLVSVLSALGPALRAGRTAPLAAMSETEERVPARRRGALGLALAGAGVATTVWGVGAGLTPTLLGAVLTLLGVVVLGPVVAGPALRLLGAGPRRLRGVVADLAQRNARRQPRRTAVTASALLIGVAVVSLFTVFGASLKADLAATFDRSFAGDVLVTAPGFGPDNGALSPELADRVAALPEVTTAVGLGAGVAEVDGAGKALTVTDPAALVEVLDLGAVTGPLTALGTGELAASADEAAAHGWSPGDRVPLAFPDGRSETFTLRAVYAEDEVAGDLLVTRDSWAPHATREFDTLVAVAFAPGVDRAAGAAAVAETAAPFGNPDVRTREEYAASAAESVDMMLTLVYALLALAVVIALLGIANTLTLSVHERVRELGLLRAVGQTRAQLRAMVRWESLLIAAFGTAGGVGLGAFLGWAQVAATDTGAFTVPVLPLLTVASAGVAAGTLAAWRPARRATRLPVLTATAAE